MGGAIDANANRNHEDGFTFSFDQNSGNFRPSDQQVIRPLHFQQRTKLRRALCDGIMDRKRSNKG